MTIAHSQETLVQDLRGLGLEAGTTIFIHSSFKSLGPVTGGAGTVISAFKDVVGSKGLILMPSFNLVEKRAETWDIETTPSTVGWLTEFFRQMDGTFRSDHYSHSVASSGKRASDFVADHLSLGSSAVGQNIWFSITDVQSLSARWQVVDAWG